MLQKPKQRPSTIAVVIPFFQRRTGVLVQALRSIFEQDSVQEFILDVIVVNDGSPIAPYDDIRKLGAKSAGQVRVVEQLNAGPAAARNIGLDAVHPDTRYVAFLDSDDQWLPKHLTTAIKAIANGADLYFSDNWVEKNVSWFECHPMTRQLISQCKSGSGIIELPGQDLVKILIEEPIMHLSTLVIDRERLGAIRFMRDLETGEDHLYALQIADRTSKAAINTLPTMKRGDIGINFYRDTLDWDSPRSAWRSLSTVRKYLSISREMAHHPEISRAASEKADVTMQETLFLVMRNFRRFPKETLGVAKDAITHWHFKCAYAAVLFIKLLRRRLQGSTDFRV